MKQCQSQKGKSNCTKRKELDRFFLLATQDVRPLPKVEPASLRKQVKHASQRFLLVHLTDFVYSGGTNNVNKIADASAGGGPNAQVASVREAGEGLRCLASRFQSWLSFLLTEGHWCTPDLHSSLFRITYTQNTFNSDGEVQMGAHRCMTKKLTSRSRG